MGYGSSQQDAMAKEVDDSINSGTRKRNLLSHHNAGKPGTNKPLDLGHGSSAIVEIPQKGQREVIRII